jgi:hypothetical protein
VEKFCKPFSGRRDVSSLWSAGALTPTPLRPRSLLRVSLMFSFPLRPLASDLGDVATTLALQFDRRAKRHFLSRLFSFVFFRLASLCASRTLSDCLSLCASVCYVPHVLIVRRFWYGSVHFLSCSLRADRSPFHEGLLRSPLHFKIL